MGRRGALIAAALLVFAAACSGSSPAGTTTPPSTTTQGGTTEPTGATTTTVPTVAPIEVPAGVQFDAPEAGFPSGAYSLVTDADGYLALNTISDPDVPVCPSGVQPCTRFASQPIVYSAETPTGLEARQIDDIATVPLPAGYRLAVSLRPSMIARNATGTVVVGALTAWDSNLYHRVALRGFAWFSRNGRQWDRVSLGDVLGDTNHKLRSVASTGSGFVAIGEVADPDLYEGPSRGVVLTSDNGETWVEAAEITSRWSVELRRIFIEDDRWVVAGVEYVCEPFAGAMYDFSRGAQSRLWSSTDHGATWTEVDLAASGVVDDLPEVPKKTDCPEYDQMGAVEWQFSQLSESDGAFLLAGSDPNIVAVSSDLSNWRTASLPEGNPTPAAVGSGVSPSRQRTLLGTAGAGLDLISFETRRDADGVAQSFGWQTIVWHSDDAGRTWQRLPLGKPIAAAKPQLLTPGEGSVIVVDDQQVWVSRPGTLQPWGTCEPGPAVDCRFAILTDLDLSDNNLMGADFTGADLSGTIFDRADLSGAELLGATIHGTSFVETDLSGASLRALYLAYLDLTGADLTGADLRGSTVAAASVLASGHLPDAQFAGARISFAEGDEFGNVDLSDRDLAGTSFAGPFQSIAGLRGADFSGSDLTQATFSALDLTGADLTGATLGEPGTAVYFDPNVICPDGSPPDPANYGPDACRLDW